MSTYNVKVNSSTKSGGDLITIFSERKAVALIDSKYCINCGKCRRICPTEAINEYQRPICRLCPDCGEGPEMFPSEIRDFAVAHSCSIGCPLGTVPEGYINLIKEGRIQDAYDLIAELNPLPSICSHVCSHPCEAECKRGLLINLNKPLLSRGLKRYVTDKVPPQREKFLKRYDEAIAVIGAGPAGITAAFDLSKKGYKVTVFEAGPKPGGMARKCIPDFRINKNTLLEEFNALEKAGIEIVYNTRVGKKPSITDILKEYAAVLIAIGASKGSVLHMQGLEYNPNRVYDAVTFMQRVNTKAPRRIGEELAYKKYVDVNVGKNAIVIGAGSVAVDTARTLKRLGAMSVKCVCIESEEKIPAPLNEVQEALEEGIIFECSASPVRIITEFETVKGMEFKRVESFYVNEQGKLKIDCKEESEFILDCDTVVFAVGQKPDAKQLAEAGNLKMSDDGCLKYDENTFMTTREGVFVAGDVIVARGSIIDAMASGRKAALAIDNFIQGREITERIKHELNLAPQDEMIYRIHMEDAAPQQIPKQRFRDTFDIVELGFTDEQAIEEATRCLKCGYNAVDQDKCIGCGACVSNCPQVAIALTKNSKKGEE